MRGCSVLCTSGNLDQLLVPNLDQSARGAAACEDTVEAAVSLKAVPVPSCPPDSAGQAWIAAISAEAVAIAAVRMTGDASRQTSRTTARAEAKRCATGGCADITKANLPGCRLIGVGLLAVSLGNLHLA
eukprot:936605-Rhodomonas_salina.2